MGPVRMDDSCAETVTISEIQILQCKIPTDLTFSYGHVDYFPVVVAKIFSGDKAGLGEAVAPLEDSIQQAAMQLIGRDATRLEALLPDAPTGTAFAGRECLAMALYDLVGKVYEIPCHALLGGARRSRIPGMPTIFAAAASEMAEHAVRFAEQGYSALKLKFVGDLEHDLACLKAVRERVGDDVALQADANLGYASGAAAEAAIGKFESFGLDIFEDPFKGTLYEYRELRNKVQLQIMVDEQARGMNRAAEVVHKRAADVINQHPSAQGSIADNVKINALAKAFGVPTAIGDTGYLGIGTAAYQCIAAVVDSTYPCGELGGHVTHGFPVGLVGGGYDIENGIIRISDAPGFAVQLNEDKLSRYVEKTLAIR